MKFICSILVGGLVAALLFGCGSDRDAEQAETASRVAKTTKAKPPPPEQVWVTAEGWKGPTDVAILTAQKLGYFDPLGNFWFGSPSSPVNPVSYVINGPSLLGVVQQPQLAIE